MKVWVDKCSLQYFTTLQSEGRIYSLEVRSFRMFDNDSEVEVELRI